MKGLAKAATIAAVMVLLFPGTAAAFDMIDAGQVAAAFMTNLAMHEAGHSAVGTMVGAKGVNTQFFQSKNGSFFLGHTEYKSIKRDARMPFLVGGPMMNCYTFEYALEDHERNPNTYNKALMFFACTDFLYYSLYAFYVAPHNDHYDPVAMAEVTGLPKEAILAVAVTQSVLNGMRAMGYQTRVIPYFTVDRYWATFNVAVRF